MKWRLVDTPFWEPKFRIGFFGGTFDPPHVGHVSIVNSAVNLLNLDKVYVCPNGMSPGKVPMFSWAERMDMCEKTFYGPKVEVVPWEPNDKHSGDYITTIETVLERALPEIQNITEKQFELYLLMGEDQASHFDSWEGASLLRSITTPIFCTRTHISSEMIREMLLEGRCVNHLVSGPVWKVLEDRQRKDLYGVSH